MLEPWHAEEYLETLNRSREHLAPWIPAAHYVWTIEDARAYVQRFADGHASDSEHLFGIRQDGRLVGVAMFLAFNPKAPTMAGTCDLGVWLAPEVQGRGLVTRSCRYLIDWAIRVRGIQRVQWTNHPDNIRSGAVAKRLGFTREGLLRSDFVLNGRRHDSEVWSMLAEEWLAR